MEIVKTGKMLLYMQKELTWSKSYGERFEGSCVLITQAKVSSNTWFNWPANQNQSTTLLSWFYTNLYAVHL